MNAVELRSIAAVIGCIIAVLNFVGIIFVYVANRFAFNKIIKNDLHHLSSDVRTVAEKQEKMNNKLVNVSEDVAYLKGSLETKKQVRVSRAKSTRGTRQKKLRE